MPPRRGSAAHLFLLCIFWNVNNLAIKIIPKQIIEAAQNIILSFRQKQLNDVLTNATSTTEEKRKVKIELEKMKSAPLAYRIFTPAKQTAA